ncbi:UDP-glycosyltransferase 91C1-like [Camellia sinensis]|uniref:UDP-glycosyltransferase 91C1-like n=1 Tax=Camellia sinensis TaxID=4442 RepID=UPI0010362A1F|nr:UDP-glycosyltransferase 91C1-like [Camellia sinensis]
MKKKFPWLAMGHLIPFLHLSTTLATKGHRISFISTDGNLRRLPQIPLRLSPLITFIPLPFPAILNLPPNAESSMDAPHHQAQLLKIAFDFLKQPLSDFLEKISPNPDWIISDYASHWLSGLATEMGVSCAFFSLFNAATMVFFGPPAKVLSGDCVRSSAEDFQIFFIFRFSDFNLLQQRFSNFLKFQVSTGQIFFLQCIEI